MRIARRIATILNGLLLLALVFLGAVVWLTPEPRLEGIGNRPEQLKAIESGGPDFRVAMLGDTQKGIETFRVLTSQLGNVDFAVHSGDMVSENDAGHWKLFFRALQVRPLVAAAGNHDLKKGPEDFARYFGPTAFTFARGSCRFFVLEEPWGGPFHADWLEREMAHSEEPNLIVVLHVPPFDPLLPGVTPRPGWEPFFDLMERYQVRYVFSGHHHDYLRREHRGTVYIVNGIGGDYEHWKLGTRAHATLLAVTGAQVRDEIFSIDPVHSVWGNVEHFALGHVTRYPVLFWVGLALLLLFQILFWFRSRNWKLVTGNRFP